MLGVEQPLVYEYSREGIVPFEKGVPTSALAYGNHDSQ
jgi:hypothetical protein